MARGWTAPGVPRLAGMGVDLEFHGFLGAAQLEENRVTHAESTSYPNGPARTRAPPPLGGDQV